MKRVAIDDADFGLRPRARSLHDRVVSDVALLLSRAAPVLHDYRARARFVFTLVLLIARLVPNPEAAT